MSAENRYQWILEKLKKDKKISSKEAARQLSTSFETIRRDLEQLEQQGKLKRIHGGAIFIEPATEIEKNFQVRDRLFAEQKKQIAEKACDFVAEGMSIAMDVSTTNTALIREFVKRFNRLTIITNSLPIIEIAATAPNFRIIVPGGILYNQERCIIGDKAIEHIEMYNIELFFMSLSGIDLKKGFTDYGHEEMKIKQAFLNRATTTVIVADASKFNTISLIPFAKFDVASCIITDDGLSQKDKTKYGRFIKIV